MTTGSCPDDWTGEAWLTEVHEWLGALELLATNRSGAGRWL